MLRRLTIPNRLNLLVGVFTVIIAGLVLILYSSSDDGSAGWALLLGIVGLILVLPLAYAVAQSIRVPLRQLEEAAGRLAVGDFEFAIDTTGTDEPGRALAGLDRVRTSVTSLIGQMNHMSAEHEKGDIDVTVDAASFEGVYRTMAQGVNDMVAAHIAVKKKAMAVVKAFGEGDFDAPLEQLPGKKAFINDTIEQVRSNLKLLITQMNHMSAEHDAGDIDVVIDVSAFQGGFATMAQGVNDMVGSHIAVKKKAMAVVKAFGEGDFDFPLEQLPVAIHVVRRARRSRVGGVSGPGVFGSLGAAVVGFVA